MDGTSKRAREKPQGRLKKDSRPGRARDCSLALPQIRTHRSGRAQLRHPVRLVMASLSRFAIRERYVDPCPRYDARGGWPAHESITNISLPSPGSPRSRFWRFWLATLLILLAGAFTLYTPSDQITRANCDRIKKGMSLQEVEAILGGPRGDYTLWPHPDRDRFTIQGKDLPRVIAPRTWEGEHGRPTWKRRVPGSFAGTCC
jgi:hypothetical protein